MSKALKTVTERLCGTCISQQQHIHTFAADILDMGLMNGHLTCHYVKLVISLSAIQFV